MVTLTREELYEKVRATPLDMLAAEFGFSGRGFAELCHRHQIPASYDTMSASKQAMIATPTAAPKANRPEPASAPAAMRNRVTGTDKHIWRANTDPNRTE
jgi:hypothetical protein